MAKIENSGIATKYIRPNDEIYRDPGRKQAAKTL